MSNNPNFLNAWGNGAGANPVGPINPQTPLVLTPQQHAILQVLARRMAANSTQQPGAPAGTPSPLPAANPTPAAQAQYQVVRHPNAPAGRPYAVQNSLTGGYVPGGSPLFPRLFQTEAEARAAIPSDEAPATPSPNPPAGLSLAGGNGSPATGPRFVVKPNPDAPARLPYGRWDNLTQDWDRDRFGFAKMYGTHSQANENLPEEAEPAVDYDTLTTNTPALVELASRRYPPGSTANTPTPRPASANVNLDARHIGSGSTPNNGAKPVTIYDVYEAAKAAGDHHPEVTAGQWYLESSGGKKPSGRFNYFNVKGPGTTIPTTEFVNGHRIHTKASFRNYNSLQQAIADHTRLLQTKRYGGYDTAKTDQQAVEALVRGGYATDPHYAGELLSIIKKYFPSKPAGSKKVAECGS